MNRVFDVSFKELNFCDIIIPGKIEKGILSSPSNAAKFLSRQVTVPIIRVKINNVLLRVLHLVFPAFAFEQRAIHHSLYVSDLLYQVYHVHIIFELHLTNVVEPSLLVTSKAQHLYPDCAATELDLTVLANFVFNPLLDDLRATPVVPCFKCGGLLIAKGFSLILFFQRPIFQLKIF